ncbi:hypothetical protein [Acinetobacter pittii]|uniref:hypothetical protein n=1 Tax=Acinetobacter pittii TaxID=48296 RepID=UPI0013EE4894|nr:hypothetical protein [Acinetobacter pittii]
MSRILVAIHRTGAGAFRTRIFSTNGSATLAYLPIHLSKFKTTKETLAFADMFARGSI